ncbi:hypothetical protein Esti_006798 [Eimeria stiedai]
MASDIGPPAAAAAAGAAARAAAEFPQDVFFEGRADGRAARCLASAHFLQGSAAGAAAAGAAAAGAAAAGAAAAGTGMAPSSSASAAAAAAAVSIASPLHLASYLDAWVGGLGGWIYSNCCSSGAQQQQQQRRLQPRSSCRGRSICVDVSLAGIVLLLWGCCWCC